MKAIPSRPMPGQPESITAISCPDCPGVLAVSADDTRLRFRCRLGRVYSLKELLAAKEQRIEDNTPTPLWDHVDLVLPLDAIAPTLIALATGKSLGSDGAPAAAAQSTP